MITLIITAVLYGALLLATPDQSVIVIAFLAAFWAGRVTGIIDNWIKDKS